MELALKQTNYNLVVPDWAVKTKHNNVPTKRMAVVIQKVLASNNNSSNNNNNNDNNDTKNNNKLKKLLEDWKQKVMFLL